MLQLAQWTWKLIQGVKLARKSLLVLEGDFSWTSWGWDQTSTNDSGLWLDWLSCTVKPFLKESLKPLPRALSHEYLILKKMSLRDKMLLKVCFLETETKLWGANCLQPPEVQRHFLPRQGALSVLTAAISLTSAFHGDEMRNTNFISRKRDWFSSLLQNVLVYSRNNCKRCRRENDLSVQLVQSVKFIKHYANRSYGKDIISFIYIYINIYVSLSPLQRYIYIYIYKVCWSVFQKPVRNPVLPIFLTYTGRLA